MISRRWWIWRSVGCYRHLLRAYPPEFRARFARDLTEAFHDAARGAWASWGLFGLVRLWVATIVDVLTQGLRERISGKRDRPALPPSLDESSGFMWSISQDLRYAFRSLHKTPGFAAVVVITLALGIGANTAIFSVVNGVLFRPLAFPNAEELVVLWEIALAEPDNPSVVAPLNFEDWRDRSTSFAGMSASRSWGPTLTGVGQAERISGAAVSHNMFSVLGVAPSLGRFFVPEEDRPNATRVVVIAHDLWQGRFGGDSGVLGRVVMLSGEPHTVVGVAPPGFRDPVRLGRDIWRPMALAGDDLSRDLKFLRVVGRLKKGVSAELAREDLSAVAAGLRAEYPHTNDGMGVTVLSLHEQIVGRVRSGLYLLLGAAGLVLLLAVANVANLLLARGSSRTTEIAVRSALGASRGRIARQMLTEGVVLAVVGGGIGIAIAFLGIDLLLAFSPPNTPRLEEVSVDATVLTASMGATLLAGVVFGLVPAWQGARESPAQAMREGGRDGTPSRRGLRARRALVATEVAVALVLLVGTGLLLKSFARLVQEDAGFQTREVLTARLSLGARYEDAEAHARFFDELLARVQRRPEVEVAAFGMLLPFDGNNIQAAFTVAGRSEDSDEQGRLSLVTPDYFRVLGIPLRSGRPFDVTDGSDAPPVVIVNQAAVNQFWSGEDPVGQRITVGINFSGPDVEREIVGVVADVRHETMNEAADPQLFVPYAQDPARFMAVVVRTGGDPIEFVPTLRAELAALDANIPLTNVATLDAMVRDSLRGDRFYLGLIALFAATAMALGLVGLYGVLSYSVTTRTHELGVRMALGANDRQVARLVVGEGTLLGLVGTGIGFAGALGLTRFLDFLLYEVGRVDPAVYGISVVLVIAVSVGASYLPALRASRVDPLEALRAE